MELRRIVQGILSLGPLGPWTRKLVLLSSQGLWPRVLGMRHVPRRGPLVIAAGHFSGIDATLLACAIPRSYGLVLSEHFFRMPVGRWFLRLRGGFPIRDLAFGYDEENLRSLERAAAAVREGGAVAIYPQGFQLEVGGGVARVASMAAAPTLPVLFYFSRGARARPRALLWVRRPVPSPAPDARSRRVFRDRLRRRMRFLGALRAEGDTRAILDVVLDDHRLWRRPARVPRAAARVRRLANGARRRLAAHARALQRGCHVLNCSVGDLRRPPGARHMALYALLAPGALVALLINGAPWAYLRIAMRKVRDQGDRRSTRLGSAGPIALIWGIVLTVVGLAVWGPVGLALPVVAGAGTVCLGAARVTRRRMIASLRIRHGGRLRRHLEAFEVLGS